MPCRTSKCVCTAQKAQAGSGFGITSVAHVSAPTPPACTTSDSQRATSMPMPGSPLWYFLLSLIQYLIQPVRNNTTSPGLNWKSPMPLALQRAAYVRHGDLLADVHGVDPAIGGDVDQDAPPDHRVQLLDAVLLETGVLADLGQ